VLDALGNIGDLLGGIGVIVTLITGESAGIASGIPACHFDFPESELWVWMKSENEYVEPLEISHRVATPCTE